MSKYNKDYYLAKALEMCLAEAPSTVVTGPVDLYPVLQPYGLMDQEHFLVVTLDGANAVIKVHVITKGLLNRTLIHPREVFRAALLDNAASIILAHNYPSGSTTPSREDKEATTRLAQAGKLMAIEVMDHMILGKTAFYSFREHGEFL